MFDLLQGVLLVLCVLHGASALSLQREAVMSEEVRQDALSRMLKSGYSRVATGGFTELTAVTGGVTGVQGSTMGVTEDLTKVDETSESLTETVVPSLASTEEEEPSQAGEAL